MNELYFKSILGKKLEGRDYIVDSDLKILKEAYDKAHTKTQFEIELHWKRTTHIWILIFALLVATGTAMGIYFTSPGEKKLFYSVVILLISIVSIIVTKTSLTILKVSHMWCHNWELHLVMLEPLFSGDLYQTHLGMGVKRLSISKLNNVFIWIAFIFWLFLFEISILKSSSSLLEFSLFSVILYAFIGLCGWLTGFTMKSSDIPSIPF